MKQMFLNIENGTVELIETPAPKVKENFVIVETKYSLVSAGTERSLTSFGQGNLIKKCLDRPDQVKKVTEKMATDGVVTTVKAAFNKLAEPMPMGYTGVGKVVESGKGVTKVQKGDTVAMVGTAYHSEVNRVNQNLVVKVPDEIEDTRQCAFGAIAGIALEGIHQAEVVPGETIAVIGLGLLGHIVSRILNAYGCDVIAYDIADKSLQETRLKAFIRSDDDNAVDKTKALTYGRGVDKVIITAATNSNAPMDLAAAITRDRAIICMIGVTQMNIDRRPYYEKELQFRIARSYGPGRYDASYEEQGVDYPIGYVRFTEGRNVEEFVRLLATNRLDVSDLITHVIPFKDAAKAYEMISTNKNHEKYIGILLQYDVNQEKWADVIRKATDKNIVQGEKIGVGLIGAGNFARATMLPNMKATGLYRFVGLATTGGPGAAQVISTTEFEYSTNDYRKLLEDEHIDLIAISTQHNSHAKFVVEALNAGKNVYCEKPLCLTLEELEMIRMAYEESTGELFVGMNRRYAPLIRQIKTDLKTDQIPAVYDYIANAGFVPEAHWTQDEKNGGGRIIGEACHFVDTIQYLDGSEIETLNVTYAENEAFKKKDNAIITLKFKSGAIANIIYSSMGSKKYPKEQLRVITDGSVVVLDNYVKLEQYGATKSTKQKLEQDKGISAEYQFISNVLKGKEENTIVNDIFSSQKLLIQAVSEK
jgi:predicted dehydrogenase/NADPH:quinone reductase-like Zn-dependent oxidoreductase